MVMAHHRKASLCQIGGKGLIAQNILGNAVSNLQDGSYVAVRKPLDGMNPVFAIGGGKGKFVSDHGKSDLLVV